MKFVVVVIFLICSSVTVKGQSTSCRTPPSIANGEIVFTPGGQDLTFTCQVGFTLIGDFNVNCTCGVWTINGFCQQSAGLAPSTTTSTPATTTTATTTTTTTTTTTSVDGNIGQQCVSYATLNSSAQHITLPPRLSESNLTLTVSFQTGSVLAAIVSSPYANSDLANRYFISGQSYSYILPAGQYYISLTSAPSGTNVQVCYSIQTGVAIPSCVNNGPPATYSMFSLCKITTTATPTKALFWSGKFNYFYLFAEPSFYLDSLYHPPTYVTSSSGRYSAPLLNTYYIWYSQSGSAGDINWQFTY